MKLILLIAVVGVILVAVLKLLGLGGPRVTTIEHRRDEKDRDDGRNTGEEDV